VPKNKVVPNGDTILNVEGVAALLGVGTRVVYRMAGDGRIPAFRLGDVWRFSRLAVEEWSRQQALENLR
jgi:excisionase family DNA binding protein